MNTKSVRKLARLRKEVRILAEERDILKRSRGLLREAEPVRFRFIAVEKASPHRHLREHLHGDDSKSHRRGRSMPGANAPDIARAARIVD